MRAANESYALKMNIIVIMYFDAKTSENYDVSRPLVRVTLTLLVHRNYVKVRQPRLGMSLFLSLLDNSRIYGFKNLKSESIFQYYPIDRWQNSLVYFAFLLSFYVTVLCWVFGYFTGLW